MELNDAIAVRSIQAPRDSRNSNGEKNNELGRSPQFHRDFPFPARYAIAIRTFSTALMNDSSPPKRRAASM
jgi:hypothetical protein